MIGQLVELMVAGGADLREGMMIVMSVVDVVTREIGVTRGGGELVMMMMMVVSGWSWKISGGRVVMVMIGAVHANIHHVFMFWNDRAH